MSTLRYDSDRTHRVGRAVLRVLVENAISLIPVYGTVLKIGYDVYKAASEEISRTEKSTFSLEEIKRAVHTLTESEVAEIVVEQLNTARARKLTESLSSHERDILKSNLLSIPDEIDKAIYEAEQSEERRKREEVSNLMENLNRYIRESNHNKAYVTAEKILRIDPENHSAKKAEKYIVDKSVDIKGGLFAFVIFLGIYYGISYFISDRFYSRYPGFEWVVPYIRHYRI